MPKLNASSPKEISPIALRNSNLSLGEIAYQEIRLAIRNRRFKSGDRLREIELANLLGLSRTPIREALSRLQAEGLATENAQRGLSIIEFDHSMVSELYVMRELLEGIAVRLLVQNAKDVEIAILRSIHEEYIAVVQQGDQHLISEKNRQFHETICLFAHNRFLMRSIYPLQDRLGLLGPSNLTDASRVKENIDDHEELLKAIEARDANSAEKCAQKHVRTAFEFRIKKMFTNA